MEERDKRYGKEARREIGKEIPKEAQKPKIDYIPNPLPLPKKHVPRTMDYDLEPPEEQMKFDLELSGEDDDFDL